LHEGEPGREREPGVGDEHSGAESAPVDREPSEPAGEPEASSGEREASTKEEAGAKGEREASTKEEAGAKGEREASTKEEAGAKGEREASAKEEAGAKSEREASTKEEAGAKSEREGAAGKEQQRKEPDIIVPRGGEKTAGGQESRKNPEPGSVVHPDPENVAKPEQHGDRYREKPPTPQEREAGWEEGKQKGKELTEQAKQAVASGDPEQVRDATLDMQANKHGLWEANRQKGPEAAKTRTKLKEDLQKVYDKTDAKVCKELGEKTGETVRAKSITNEPKPGDPPKDPSKMSIDRDITYERTAKKGELIPHPTEQGKFVEAKGGEWVDVPAKTSSDVYAKHFKESALESASEQTKAKYKDMPPQKFAKQMDQTVTDRLADDAYGRGPGDLHTAVSNPAGEFSDPNGVGKTAEFKANEWYEKAEREANTPQEHETYVAEGMRQTTKQYGNQVQNRLKAINGQRGPGTANPESLPVTPPGELKAGMEIMGKVSSGENSPAQADAALAKIGLTRGEVAQKLGEFINKIYRVKVGTPS
jgi:hypothetical protein